jgi:prepilin-type N-terminal cleavage/methylation domain-containing protein
VTRPDPRPGFTLIEVLAVLAVLVILGAVLVPSTASLWGNTYQQAAADDLRGRLADARGLAMEHGVPYRLAVHQDGARLRLAPEGPDFASAAAAEQTSATTKVLEVKLEKATVSVVHEMGDMTGTADGDGWQTIATFLPDGTCREGTVLVNVNQDTFPPLVIQVRGVTGAVKVLPAGSGTNTPGAKP